MDFLSQRRVRTTSCVLYSSFRCVLSSHSICSTAYSISSCFSSFSPEESQALSSQIVFNSTIFDKLSSLSNVVSSGSSPKARAIVESLWAKAMICTMIASSFTLHRKDSFSMISNIISGVISQMQWLILRLRRSIYFSFFGYLPLAIHSSYPPDFKYFLRYLVIIQVDPFSAAAVNARKQTIFWSSLSLSSNRDSARMCFSRQLGQNIKKRSRLGTYPYALKRLSKRVMKFLGN